MSVLSAMSGVPELSGLAFSDNLTPAPLCCTKQTNNMEAHELATKGAIWEAQQRILARMDRLEMMIHQLVTHPPQAGKKRGEVKSSYSARDLMDMFQVSHGTIRNWRLSGLLGGIQPSGPEGHWRYPYETNKDFINLRLGQTKFKPH